MRFGAEMVAKAIARLVLGVADGSQCRDLKPTLARIGACVGLREAHNTNNSSSSVVGDIPVDGLMPLGRP